MSRIDVVLQPVVRQKALELGAAGAAWLARLPDLLAALERDWSITLGESLAGGTSAYVATARTADGRNAVLKLAVPDPVFSRQIETLDAAQGRGYLRLLAHDAARHAVLLEALGPSLNRVGLSPEEQLGVLCDVLPLAWQSPSALGLTSESAFNKARGLAELVGRFWTDLDGPCQEQAVTYALTCADRRAAAFEPERCVVVHGDAAAANVLRVLAARAGAPSGYVLVDPDGFVGDPTYDLGVALRDWHAELLAGDASSVAHRYCRLLAALSGMDEAAIWEWGFLERVSTGLYLLSLDAEDLARPFLATAEAIVAGRRF